MRASFRLLSLSLFMLLMLAGCGGGGGGSGGSSGSGDWFFVWNCNGDSECLSTNAAGTPSGSLDEGPDESSCTPLVTFAQKFWGSAATYACTQNPNGGGGGTSSVPSSTTSNAIPVGMYAGTGTFTGTETINGLTSNFDKSPSLLEFVTSSGAYMLLSYNPGSPAYVSQIDEGSFVSSLGTITSHNDMAYPLWENYSSDTFPVLYSGTQNATYDGTFLLNSDLNGNIVYSGSQGAVLKVPVNYVAASVTPVTLAAIAKTFTGAFYQNGSTGTNGFLSPIAGSITISSTGVLSGTVDCAFTSVGGGTTTPCMVSGTVTARTDLGAYDISISFTNGTNQSFPSQWGGKTATGLLYYDAGNGKILFGAVAPDNTAFAFSN